MTQYISHALSAELLSKPRAKVENVFSEFSNSPTYRNLFSAI